VKSLFLSIIFALLIQGCGYKPRATYTRGVLGEKVSVFVDVYAADPGNSVIIKDAVLQSLITRFGIVTTKRDFSISHLDVKLSELIETAIEYDVNGYVVAQRETVKLQITRTTKGVKKIYNVEGTFDFAIPANATVSESDRFKAIKSASLKAIDVLIVQLAVEGSM
jgi:hypothetical protein